jgi:2-octaprenyl-6-methoxyphenol hydroxylase
MASQMNQLNHNNLAIAGGGHAGLMLALAVKSALGESCQVTVYDPNGFEPRAHDLRASAISANVRQNFENLGIWDVLRQDAQPIHEMVITDTALEEPVRPKLLSFENKGAQPFAHMVGNNALSAALKKAVLATGVRLVQAPVIGYLIKDEQVEISHGVAEPSYAQLLVAADGARSSLREQAGIAFYGWDYGQMALVATIKHERPHHGRAIEHFLPSGPFAILPLAGNRSSIVWTEKDADAKRLMEMQPDQILLELERRFGLELGELTLLTPIDAWPLKLGLARRFISERLALIGDAAHVIHPIAGQGLNLGLKDAFALAARIIDQARLGLDIGDMSVLEAYERDRRFDTSTMAVTTDVLNRLFSNDSAALRAIRGFGLGIVERMPSLKRFFIGQAAGVKRS